MTKRILVDAVHPEEKRVVVLENGRIQEYDSETSLKQQFKGNVYLAKVTRVEPSLQAAFVEYGRDRQGFLPFSEIHPDYYQIPVSDREALKKSLMEVKQEAEAQSEAELDAEDNAAPSEEEGEATEIATKEEAEAEAAGSDKSDRALRAKRNQLLRKYTIQEVIKRNQVILVQVEKEERGNKGASLTTYITLAGRYCVLMPNAARSGGVSRRISSFEDRKRLKRIVRDLGLPQEASIIVRTAGSGKSQKAIQHDYDYLAGLWNRIREATLAATAPAFIHGEEGVIRRTIRDLYDDDVKELLIEGDEDFKAAKEFMQTLMPERAADLKHYKNKVPIFSRYKVEEQIVALYGNTAALESGGYLVLNPTEALISIDVNSGKSTSGRNVEQTALATNLEAAEEVARQLRLRDLAGLIVVDFIDMMELKNRKQVERKLKDALQRDRARVQVGRISQFGLLEMSRQRLRPSFNEINTVQCEHCHGTGSVKAVETLAINVLRALDQELSRTSNAVLDTHVPGDVLAHIVNQKRDVLAAMEERYSAKMYFHVDGQLGRDDFRIQRTSGKAVEQAGNDNRAERPATERTEGSRGRKGRNNEPINIAAHPAKELAAAEAGGGSKSGGLLQGLWRKIIE